EHGAEVDARENLRGTTALMWAAAYSNPDAVRALLEAGADYGARSAAVARGRRPYLAPPARERIEEYITGTGSRGAALEFDLDGADEDADASDDTTNDAADAERASEAGAAPGGAPSATSGDLTGDVDALLTAAADAVAESAEALGTEALATTERPAEAPGAGDG